MHRIAGFSGRWLFKKRMKKIKFRVRIDTENIRAKAIQNTKTNAYINCTVSGRRPEAGFFSRAVAFDAIEITQESIVFYTTNRKTNLLIGDRTPHRRTIIGQVPEPRETCIVLRRRP